MESFVVRVWVPGDNGRRAVDTVQLRGSVRHVASGTEARFSDDRVLLDLLHAAVARPSGSNTAPDAHLNLSATPSSMVTSTADEGETR